MRTLYLVCNAHLDPVWLWIRKRLRMKGFEVKTYKLSPEAGTLEEVSLTEHELENRGTT